MNDNRKKINKDDIHKRNRSENFSGLPSTKLKTIKPLILQPKITPYAQERGANREPVKFGSVPRVGKTADKQHKKNE